MEWVPHYEFRRLVSRYRGSYKVKSFSCWDQFLCLAFAQLTYRESLRDIEACLCSRAEQLYHLGFRSDIARSTLADANETRDWRIYRDLAQKLITRARRLYATEELAVALDQVVYALDSTTIDLCLSLFPWAHFRKTKAAVKLHTLLDLRGSIPTFIHFTDGKCHDVNVLDVLPIEPGAFYVIDRGYLDFQRLSRFVRAMAYFVTRAKTNLNYRRIYSHPVPENTGVCSDQTIKLSGKQAATNYPDKLRRIRFRDPDSQKLLVFLSNNFELPAATIAQLYKARWKIELFFKWIKQHLRIKAFYGTSDNAVRTQVWSAVCVYVLIAIVKKNLDLKCTLYTFLQVLSVNAFEKVPIAELLTKQPCQDDDTNDLNWLRSWDL